MPPFVSIKRLLLPENAKIIAARDVLFTRNARIITKKQEKIWWNKIKALPLHSQFSNEYANLYKVS